MSTKRRKTIRRISVELPNKLHEDLVAALKTRAARMQATDGEEHSAEIAPWIRAKARETVEAYR